MENLRFRDATELDLHWLVTLLRDDAVGPTIDDPSDALRPGYASALAAITADPNQHLIIAELDGASVGTFQITYTPGLARRGAWRATIESVHVVPGLRSRGIGAALIGYSVDLARDRGCALVQLTSNKSRDRAHAFYERLGFSRSHEGFKLTL